MKSDLGIEHGQDSAVEAKTRRIMWFESIVLLAAEPFSIYPRILESLIALGRPYQSTFGIKEDRKARFFGIAIDLLVKNINT